jgi:hypothetical protein
VNNLLGKQVGYIDRHVAARLAPLMDDEGGSFQLTLQGAWVRRRSRQLTRRSGWCAPVAMTWPSSTCHQPATRVLVTCMYGNGEGGRAERRASGGVACLVGGAHPGCPPLPRAPLHCAGYAVGSGDEYRRTVVSVRAARGDHGCGPGTCAPPRDLVPRPVVLLLPPGASLAPAPPLGRAGAAVLCPHQ